MPPEYLKLCEKAIKLAVKDLGPNLAGYSAIDLLLDQFEMITRKEAIEVLKTPEIKSLLSQRLQTIISLQ